MLPRLPISFQLALLILFLQGFHQAYSNSCSSYLVTDTETPFDCSNLGSFSASPPTPDFTRLQLLFFFSSYLLVPSGLKTLSVSFTFKPTSLCSGSVDYVPVTVSIIPPGSSTRKGIMSISFRNNVLFFNGEDNVMGRTFTQRVIVWNHALQFSEYS